MNHVPFIGAITKVCLLVHERVDLPTFDTTAVYLYLGCSEVETTAGPNGKLA